MRSAPTVPDNRIKLIQINGLIARDEGAYMSRKAAQYAAICSGYVPKLARDDLGSRELFQSHSVGTPSSSPIQSQVPAKAFSAEKTALSMSQDLLGREWVGEWVLGGVGGWVCG